MSATLRGAGVALLLIVLAACKGGEENAAAVSGDWPSFDAPAKPAESGPPLPAACELVTAEQVSKLLGSEAGLMADDPENCAYTSMQGAGHILMFMVQVQQADDLDMAKQVFNGIAGMYDNVMGAVNDLDGAKQRKSGREVEDLGDEAQLLGASVGPSMEGLTESKDPAAVKVVNGNLLVVRKGRRILTLNVTGSVKDAGLGQRLEALAHGIVPRL